MGIAAQLWPRFGKVFPLELALSLTVMVVAWFALGIAGVPAVFKARLTEAWLSVSPVKYQVIERMALDGQPGRGEIDEARNLSRYVSSRRMVGAAVTVSGDIPGFRGYEVGFYPALAEDGAVVLWLCGRAAAPQGWTAQAAAPATNLPDHLLPSQCRGRPTR